LTHCQSRNRLKVRPGFCEKLSSERKKKGRKGQKAASSLQRGVGAVLARPPSDKSASWPGKAFSITMAGCQAHAKCASGLERLYKLLFSTPLLLLKINRKHPYRSVRR